MTTAPRAPPAPSSVGADCACSLAYVLDQGWTARVSRGDGGRLARRSRGTRRRSASTRSRTGCSRAASRHGDPSPSSRRTRLEWILLDWAMMSIGAVVVGLYPTNSAKECAVHPRPLRGGARLHRGRRCSARSSPRCAAQLPALREIIPLRLARRSSRPRGAYAPRTWRARRGRARGRRRRPRHADLHVGHDRAAEGLHAHAPEPRHRRDPRADDTSSDGSDVVLLFLPLAHSFGRLAHQAAAYSRRDRRARRRRRPACRRRSAPCARRSCRPSRASTRRSTRTCSARSSAAGGLRSARSGSGRSASARARAALRRAGRPVPALLALQERARRQARLREGDASGSAAACASASPAPRRSASTCSSSSTRSACSSIEGYGLTETASSLTRQRSRRLPVRHGRPRRSRAAEIRLDEDGEILVRSDTVFAGYYKDPEATAAAFTDDGWFRTGDVGEIDADGFLKITDRKKDLIITAGGKNIAPQNLENALKTSRFVSQALVVGDRRPYVTALITLDQAEVAASGRDPQELVQEIVDDVNRDRVRVEQIKRFAILPRDFSQEEGEVTPTLKLRRKVVHEHFADEIEELYSLTAGFSDRIRVPRERGRVRRGADDRPGGRRLARLALGARGRRRRNARARGDRRCARPGADAHPDLRAAAHRRRAAAHLRAAVAAQGDPARERLQGAARRGGDLRARARGGPRRRHEQRAGLDWYGFTLAFKGVLLEGLEVAFIVVTFGSTQGSIGLAALGAAARSCSSSSSACSSARRSPACRRTR